MENIIYIFKYKFFTFFFYFFIFYFFFLENFLHFFFIFFFFIFFLENYFYFFFYFFFLFFFMMVSSQLHIFPKKNRSTSTSMLISIKKFQLKTLKFLCCKSIRQFYFFHFCLMINKKKDSMLVKQHTKNELKNKDERKRRRGVMRRKRKEKRV